MRFATFRTLVILLVLALVAPLASASAYNGHPKLVVIVVIDQFRADYLERWRDQFGDGGFNLLLQRGAYFSDCYYDYSSTETAPGHTTLLTGAYPQGHGIFANDWWDPSLKKSVTSVEDATVQLVGITGTGASPKNLHASTLGDELKLATGGKARVFTISLKDRSAILPGGHAADVAYWIDSATGVFITSSFYRADLPAWVKAFDAEIPQKAWGREWKDANGKVLRSIPKTPTKDFYHSVGDTPFATAYELEFAAALIENEKLGAGDTTDLLVISLSANDIIGHEAGPDSPEVAAMTVETDHALADFFSFLAKQVGLANTWIALTADHGVGPTPAVAGQFRFPQNDMRMAQVREQLNAALSARFRKKADYITYAEWPGVYLSEPAFTAAGLKEADAERVVGEALLGLKGFQGYFTKSQLASGQLPPTDLAREYAHSYSPYYGGWMVFPVPSAYGFGRGTGTDHFTPYAYDRHVPLAFFGVPFLPGTYRTKCEPVDMVATLASLLSINKPSHAVGRVLNEALAPARLTAGEGR